VIEDTSTARLSAARPVASPACARRDDAINRVQKAGSIIATTSGPIARGIA
jgi:hypothetical protein